MGHKTRGDVGLLHSYIIYRILVLKNLKYYGSEYKASVPIVESVFFVMNPVLPL